MIYAGTVIKVEEALDGSPMYTVTTPNGAVYFPCFVSSSCGGFDAKYMMSPVSEGAEVVISSVNRGKVYYIIGGIPDNADQVAVSTSAQTSLNMDADYNGHHHTETVLRNTNSTINMSPVHDLTLKSPNMRLQLNEGVLRISQQGTSENYILNGQPFLDELFEYIAEMEARINTLTGAVEKLLGPVMTSAQTDPLTRAVLATYQVPLSTNISSSAVAKSDCESTQNTSIKIP
tara:strand:- start:6493 stop:7188 length:696 start_codon:yes stop_codon:yes gene_type:complete